MHLITVNDYLARFHAEWMGRLHRFLGLKVGTIVPDDSTPDEKRAQYDCDITYGTNNEFGFDYLRDNMVVGVERAGAARCIATESWSPHFFAIVDEVDSILIDEARTPLIISGRATDAAELYYQFARIVRRPAARPRLRGRRSQAHRRAHRRGHRDGSKQALGVENLYEHVQPELRAPAPAGAARARSCSSATSTTSSHDGEVKIVDEFTGRILEGRRWSEGLHQAVEAKEGVQDQRREPDARDGHAAELLPHVRQARRA